VNQIFKEVLCREGDSKCSQDTPPGDGIRSEGSLVFDNIRRAA